MKKAVISLFCLFLITGSAFAKTTQNNLKIGITQYKQGNYIGAMQTLQDVVAKDPGNSLAHYYLAIAYVRVGKIQEARQEYQKVTSLNPSSELAFYASTGLKHLSSISEPASTKATAKPGTEFLPPPPELTPGPPISRTPTQKSQDFMSEQAKNTLIEKNINSIINNANQNGSVPPEKLDKVEKMIKQKSENATPSNEEIAEALKTLSQAGMNLNLNPSQNLNPEAMQLNMMMGLMGGNNNMNNNTNNNPMNMLSLMMMYQNPENAKNMDPQLMETMISGMMMPNMFSVTNSNDNNNY
ncbi:MAG: hypothetical protein A2287_00550 [Candidatus Melainabacteria bacterium RIFOXYA12_FULL_32_12]|nr:MAG: hypothetical protein A2255_10690 [Candidatus Melainabacteria bacterium RIFOXYA2_FULL_32_9]OGI26571.1 MAG: hypothetical protein A2287_00550 [Candidatus Melainabacteria bacterium RIFOXYA12_FULL_32_12]